MNDSAASLDRLHDVVVPDPVPLWPPAPGWYVVIAIVTCGVVWSSYRCWRRWRTNAYRREALRELAIANSPAAVAELLRRVALAVASRHEIAERTGEIWAEWLATRCPEPMSQRVREQLAGGIYRRTQPDDDVAALKSYAACWISRRRTTSGSSTTPSDPTV